MQEIIDISTNSHNGLFDITDKIRSITTQSKVQTGVVSVYVQGATAGIMIQENWDDSVQNDVISLFNKLIPRGVWEHDAQDGNGDSHLKAELIPRGVWEHDAQDGNGDSHLKAGIVGPSETIPIIDGKLGLSTWQNIFLCEFDGPRSSRKIAVTIIAVQAT